MGSTSSKDHDSHPGDLGTITHKNYSGTAHSTTSSSSGFYHGGGGGTSSGSHGGDGINEYNPRNRSSEGMDMEIDHQPSPLPSPIRRNFQSEHSPGPNAIMREEIVPMVFRWEHGGRNVFITGTFNGWSKQVPMHRSGNDFTYIANLARGKHAYKFVVDEEWRFAPDQPTVADVEGNINNYVDVSDFTPLSDMDMVENDDHDEVDSMYGRFIPDIDEYTKEPPPLPPHLRHIILNKSPPSVDCRLLPVPQHVALNHLYCTAIKDGMMVLGITQRYKQKFVTTVYYSLMPNAN